MMLMLMLSAVLTASGQGEWKSTVIHGDELKGVKGGVVHIYTQPEMGSFVFWGFDKFLFRLTSDKCQFNTKISGEYIGITIHVGIYSDDGQLIEKFDMWLDKEDNYANMFVKTRNEGAMSNPIGQKGKVKKIFKALQNGNGYVRIVCERYHNTDYDLKIVPFKENQL